MALRCKFNHAHPLRPLRAATNNPSRPHGPRPYHCPDCSEITKAHTVAGNWITYPDVASAVAAGHLYACSRCFPSATASADEGSRTLRSVSHPTGPASSTTPTPATADDLVKWRRQLARHFGKEPDAGVTADELGRWRRQLLRILDTLDQRAAQGAGPAARIAKLRNEGRIPRDTAAQMLVITESRNAAEYEGRSQTPAGAAAVRTAWLAVAEWARSKGIAYEAS
jgi:hypothetical protein